MKKTIAGVDIPEGVMAQAATDLIRGTESELMFHHALRAFLFAALTGYRENLTFDAQLLYVGAMFHNVGLNAKYERSPYRFEVDGANAARDFLRRHGVAEREIEEVWVGIALHTTPGIPEHLSALVALISAGVQMDVRGARYDEFTAHQRDEIVQAYPRESGFKKKLIEAYAHGMEHRPETTFGSVNADVLDRWDPNYRRLNFCGLVLGSDWPN
ncbi:HD domain-containing protein [Burkholderia sp. Ch1-1]|uniref:HD domain-containing protein n=1 Tax=Paraburkholderia dioscoreae TaxID=2604047 RepID=A0A5Q4YXA1_9BURK|nr:MULTISPECIES: HD domain-containing protein [Paraburkholderia]EIF33161.1 HD domain-containing protein [Burkholderia sp. Ch1-1]MDR8399975.1 HD domain-containing protein [Paraburkholderia sp. USG1]VVD31982.1 HD domain-containing protein [Paraburkholderia dioscoreae]